MLENFITLVLILTPLVVGFLLPLPQRFMPLVDKLLTNLVFVILTFIGLSLSQIANLGAQIGFIGTNVAVLAICTHKCIKLANICHNAWFKRAINCLVTHL